MALWQLLWLNQKKPRKATDCPLLIKTRAKGKSGGQRKKYLPEIWHAKLRRCF